MSKTKIIKKLKNEIRISKKFNEPVDEASWGMEEGILLTQNEAIEIVKLIDVKRGKEE